MIPVLFRNNHFLAVDKPYLTLTIPGRFPEKNRTTVVSHALAEQEGVRLWVVHRLDKEVSGVLLFALSAEAHRAANVWFERRTVKKTYEALTEAAGYLPGTTDKWVSLLVRGKKRAYERPFGKQAVTIAHFEDNRKINDNVYGVWRLEPKTGRPHQLRFELAKRELPILGDRLYGSQREFLEPGCIALRSVEIDFHDCQDRDRFSLPDKIRASGLVSVSH